MNKRRYILFLTLLLCATLLIVTSACTALKESITKREAADILLKEICSDVSEFAKLEFIDNFASVIDECLFGYQYTFKENDTISNPHRIAYYGMSDNDEYYIFWLNEQVYNSAELTDVVTEKFYAVNVTSKEIFQQRIYSGDNSSWEYNADFPDYTERTELDFEKDFIPYPPDQLPPEIITPIEYCVWQKIYEDGPMFKFTVYGENIKSDGSVFENGEFYFPRDMNQMSRIVIECEETNYKQELKFEETHINNIFQTTFGFDLDDWNFDGYLDVSLWKHVGGTALNSPHYYWLWDSEINAYIKNDDLEEISDSTYMEIDAEKEKIKASQRRPDGYYDESYKWMGEEIVLVRTEEVRYTVTFGESEELNEVKGHRVITELIDGEMKVIEDSAWIAE